MTNILKVESKIITAIKNFLYARVAKDIHSANKNSLF